VDYTTATVRPSIPRRSAAERPRDSRPYHGARLASHRPAAVAQRRLAEFVNASPRVQASLSSLPARASGRGPPVIQRAIAYNAPQVPAGLAPALTPAMTAYNVYAAAHLADNTEASLHEEFRLLDVAERTINLYLRNNGGRVSNAQRLYLFGLLSGAEADHLALVRRTQQHGRRLWLRNEGGLGAGEAVRRRGIWGSLTANAGNVQVQGGAAFQTEVHAGFARLLQGAHGTQLLGDLNANRGAADQEIHIAENHAATYAHHRQAHDPTASFAAPMGLITRLAGQATAHLQGAAAPGAGTGSFVQLAPPRVLHGLEDHMADTGMRALHMPRFVTLGHELGHARRMRTGTALDHGWGAAHPVTDPVERGSWGEPEEYANIRGQENAIRNEHQMPNRMYHTTLGGARAARNQVAVDAGIRNLDGWLHSLRGYLTLRQRDAYADAIMTVRVDFTRAGASDAVTAVMLRRIATLRSELRWHYAASVGHSVRSALTPTRNKLLVLGGLAVAGIGAYLAQRKKR